MVMTTGAELKTPFWGSKNLSVCVKVKEQAYRYNKVIAGVERLDNNRFGGFCYFVSWYNNKPPYRDQYGAFFKLL